MESAKQFVSAKQLYEIGGWYHGEVPIRLQRKEGGKNSTER